MTGYDILDPQFNPVVGAPTDELLRYRAWFLEIIPARVRELERVVRQSPGFEGWRADGTPASLPSLGEWFAGQVETRPITEDERKAMKKAVPYAVELPSTELTHRTLSLVVDIAIYFSQVLMRNVPGLRWDQDLKDKRRADYGRLVLVGTGRVPLNPVTIVMTLAYGLAAKGQTGQRLAELYTIWVRMLHPDDERATSRRIADGA